MKRRLVGLSLLVGGLALLSLTGCVRNDVAEIERGQTFTVTEGYVELGVGSSNGRILVVGAEGATTVEVAVTLRSYGSTLTEAMVRVSQIEVVMAQEGNRITIEYDAADHPLDVRLHSGVDFVVTVPQETHVEADTSNGRIEVQGVSGILDLETSNGRIEIRDALAEIHARTSNGRILAERVEGILDLETSNGRIEMESIEGVVSAETTNGEITFSGMLIPDVDHLMVTSNGGILLAIRSDASLIIDAEVSNGLIVSTLPLIGDTVGNKWYATLNPPATGTLTLQTTNGQIEMHGIF